VDTLDLIFRRIVLAAKAAGALERQVTVGEILESFAPYVSARRDGPIATHDDYLEAVMRLVSGERDLLFGDDLMQDDLKAELDAPNPDVTVIKTYAQSKVRLSTEGVQRVLAGDTKIDLRPPTPFSPRPGVRSDAAPGAPPATAKPGAPAASPSPPGSAPVPSPATAAAAIGGDPHTSPGRDKGLFAAFDPLPKPDTEDAGCPYCAQPVPEGRTVKFCPACGQNLTVRRCPGCSAEIESGWKFCVTCGRSAR